MDGWEKTAEGGQRYVDGKWVVVDYGRPLLRGRTPIFGTGADYGKMVTGDAADLARRRQRHHAAHHAGAAADWRQDHRAGRLQRVRRSEANQWTLVLNTQEVQPQFDPADKVRLSGATNYDAKFDVLRVPMKVGTRTDSLEQFAIAFCERHRPARRRLSCRGRRPWRRSISGWPVSIAAPGRLRA